MWGFTRWFSPSPSKSTSSGSSSTSSNSNRGMDRVLHGRVSKLAHTNITSKSQKYETLTQVIGKEEGSKVSFGAIKREEGYNDSVGDKINGEQFPVALPMAMMAKPVDSEDNVSQQSDAKHSDNDDTDSDSDSEKDTAWRLEQIYLNIILGARNEFALMPLSWKMHFRGIPLPDGLFYDHDKSKSIRPRIYAHTNRLEYRGALTLRRLIDIHARIQDIRKDEAEIKNDKGKSKADKKALIRTTSADIVKQLRRVLEQALNWAKEDGGISKYDHQLPPNVRVMVMRDITMSDNPDWETKIQNEMCDLADAWRNCAANGDAPVQVPVLFGFVILKHIITIVTLDASDPGAIISVPCQLKMAEKNQHQWNALAILVTICWARDVLLDYINARSDLDPDVKAESSDPDA